MKVYEIQNSFGLECLKIMERPNPAFGPQEVLIKVKAVSLNYRDLLMIRGLYNPRQKLPLIPASDGVGEVIAVGEDVRRVKVGDRVAGLFVQDWVSGLPTKDMRRTTLGGPLNGMLAEKVVLPESGVIHFPKHLSFEEAATLPCAALTAWSALTVSGGVKPGDTVLVLGTGGVSIFALQFARMMGARVIVTSKSDEKLQRAAGLGASECVNYERTPNWGKAVLKLTNGLGVDHVIEVGGAGTLEQSLQAVRLGGCVSLIGVLSGGKSEVDLRPILMGNVRVQGVFVGHRQSFEEMNRALEFHKLRPVVDRTYPFHELSDGLKHMQAGQHFGKICIRCSG